MGRTGAGHVFRDEARKPVLQAGHAAEAARHTQRGESGGIRISIASGLGGVAGQSRAEHCRRFPAINAECKDVFSTVQKVLYKRETEVGSLGSPVDHVKLDCELPFEEEFVVILPKSHRLGQSANFYGVKDVADEPDRLRSEVFPPGCRTRDWACTAYCDSLRTLQWPASKPTRKQAG